MSIEGSHIARPHALTLPDHISDTAAGCCRKALIIDYMSLLHIAFIASPKHASTIKTSLDDHIAAAAVQTMQAACAPSSCHNAALVHRVGSVAAA